MTYNKLYSIPHKLHGIKEQACWGASGSSCNEDEDPQNKRGDSIKPVTQTLMSKYTIVISMTNKQFFAFHNAVHGPVCNIVNTSKRVRIQKAWSMKPRSTIVNQIKIVHLDKKLSCEFLSKEFPISNKTLHYEKH